MAARHSLRAGAESPSAEDAPTPAPAPPAQVEQRAGAREKQQEEQQQEQHKLGNRAADRSAGAAAAGSGKARGGDKAKEAGAASPPKKVFEAAAAQKPTPCLHCGKTVYKTEHAADSKDRVFHATCLRCVTCKTPLLGKEPITDRDQLVLSPSQYRHDLGEPEEEGLEPTRPQLYCHKHGLRTRGTVHEGTTGKDERAKRAVKEAAALHAAAERAQQNDAIKEEMEVLMGDAAVICARCGGALANEAKVIVSGMEKFHDGPCPDEHVDGARKPRHFVKKAEARPVAVLTIGERPFTFMFDLDEASRRATLLPSHAGPAHLRFPPDAKQASGTERKVSSEAALADMHLKLRHAPGATHEDPTGIKHAPQLGLAIAGALCLLGDKEGKLRGKKAPGPDAKLAAALHYDGRLELGRAGGPVLSPALSVGPAATASLRLRADEDGPGFALMLAPGEPAILFHTDNDFQAIAWLHALQHVVKTLASEKQEQPEAAQQQQRIVFRLFLVQSKVLHHFVYTFAVDTKALRLRCLDDAEMFLSEWPEPTPQETTRADPLAELKKHNAEKKEQAERLAKEEADALARKANDKEKQPPPKNTKQDAAQKHTKSKGKGGCVIA
jgi:hypothetical protein